jgi:MFS family permease
MLQSSTEKEERRAVRWALASLSLSMLLSSLGTSIANDALPTLAQAFDASFGEVQWVVLAYLLASTTLVVVAGRMGDVVGRRRLLLAGLALFAAASLVCGVAPALWLLVAARAAQGLGAAVMLALAVALVGETVPKERTGSAMGLLGTTSAIGTALGPSLGGLLIAETSWRAIFLVNLPLGLLALLLAYRYLPADRRAPNADRAAFDVTGTLLLARALGAGLGTSALVAAVMMATLVVGPFYLSRALGLGAAGTGLVMAAGPLVAALAGVPSGRFVDRFGAHRMTALGLVGIGLGALGLSLAPAGLGIAGYVASIVVATSGYALFQAANNTAVMAGAGPDRRGVVSGLLNLSRNLGLVTGASAMGALFALSSGASDVASASPEAVAAGMRATFAVAATLVAVALASRSFFAGLLRSRSEAR